MNIISFGKCEGNYSYKDQIVKWLIKIIVIGGYIIFGIDSYDAMTANKCYTSPDVETNYYGYGMHGYYYSINKPTGSIRGRGFRNGDIILLEFNVKEQKLIYYKIRNYQTIYEYEKEVLCALENIRASNDEQYKFALSCNGYGAKVELLHFQTDFR